MQEKLSNIIGEWVDKNKKSFWKYEVSCFHKTYKISVLNLPNPTAENVKISPDNRSLNNNQKIQLCNAIKKICAKASDINISYIEVKVDYESGDVAATIV